MKGTPEELKAARAIAALKRLERNWPETLWIFAADGGLYVMLRGPDGERVKSDTGGVHQDYIVEKIGIPADGGDW